MGEVAIGEGEGVLASGDRGMLCTDLRRCGDLTVCSLCLRPCRELGRPRWAELAGELGVLEPGDELCDELVVEWAESEAAGDHVLVVVGGERGDTLVVLVGEPGRLSPDDRERLRRPKLRLGVRGEGMCCSWARRLLSLLKRDDLRASSLLL